jgi:hypothetical protein
VPAASKSLDEYHGEVLTRRWVVDAMLDYAGYSADRDLAGLRFVEPAAGTGAFVLPALDRLSQSLRTHGRSLGEAYGSFRAFELQADNVEGLRLDMVKLLVKRDWPVREAQAFVQRTVIHGDYLLTPHEPKSADVVVGNPPYIRYDDLGADRLRAYRAVSPAMVGRADIYIAFFDVGLDTLADGGVLVFICADRWMRNDYGRGLRKKVVTGGFAVDLTLVVHEADCFEEDVSAYPAITIFRRGEQGRAALARGDERFHAEQAAALKEWLQDPKCPLVLPGLVADSIDDWFNTEQSWPDGSPALVAWLEHLEETLPLIEETGIRFGIGIATGADKVYVVKAPNIPDIEPERLLPLVVADDIRKGVFTPTGCYLVNPYDHQGLVDLKDWPKFAAYLEEHPALKERHTAKANPGRWWKTIDPVNYGILERPKLLFQDMKAQTTPVFHPGGLYPHHNLYYAVATNERWDLHALGGLMLSKVFEAQVAAYCVKMRGETLRFQTQYLRRVRVPQPERIPADIKVELARAFNARDREAADRAALAAYRLSELPV